MSIENPANERERQVKQLYINHLGRDPDPGGWQHYVFDQNIPIDIVERHIKGSDEYWRRHNSPRFPANFGGDAGRPQQNQAFGSADYIAALKAGGESNVRRTRNEVLDWLRQEEGWRWLAISNRRGQSPEGGPINLFDRIEGAGSPNRDINPSWGDHHNDPTSMYFFTHDDLLATRAIRFRDEEIKSVLDQNPDWLRDADKPGVPGGVYESLNLTLDNQPDHDTTRPESPRVTRIPSEYNVAVDRETISQPERDSLKMTPGQAFVGRTARGMDKAKRTRRRVQQTTDLQRSLNIS